jgi:hypothetical protein
MQNSATHLKGGKFGQCCGYLCSNWQSSLKQTVYMKDHMAKLIASPGFPSRLARQALLQPTGKPVESKGPFNSVGPVAHGKFTEIIPS